MRGKFKDLIDREFTRLLVIKRVGYSKGGDFQWLCLCDCGNITIVSGSNLKSGNTKSCGCMYREQCCINGQLRRTHGMRNTPEYQAWRHAKQRCGNPNNSGYKDYGGRGIEFCQCWRGPNGFKNFLKDMGRRPGSGYSIERLANDGNYTPDNCVWILAKEQQGNTRRNKRFKGISIIGRGYVSKNQSEFARQFNLSSTGICDCLHGRRRQYKGWTFAYTGGD